MHVLAALGQGPEHFLSHLYLRNITRVGLPVLWGSGQGYQGCNVTLEKCQVKPPSLSCPPGEPRLEIQILDPLWAVV